MGYEEIWKEAMKIGVPKMFCFDIGDNRYPIGGRDPDAPYPSRHSRRARAGQLAALTQWRKELEAWYKRIGKRAGWRKIYFLSVPWPPKACPDGCASIAIVEPRTKGAKVGFAPPGVRI